MPLRALSWNFSFCLNLDFQHFGSVWCIQSLGWAQDIHRFIHTLLPLTLSVPHCFNYLIPQARKTLRCFRVNRDSVLHGLIQTTLIIWWGMSLAAVTRRLKISPLQKVGWRSKKTIIILDTYTYKLSKIIMFRFNF